MAKLTLTDLSGQTGLPSGVATVINANNNALKAAIENTLSRDGTLPNSMNADLDLNDNDILNVSSIGVTTVTASTVTANTASTTTLNATNIFLDGQELSLEGVVGPPGDVGVGVPTGGTTGQVLTKVDNADYNTTWSTISGGGAGLVDGDYGDITVSGSGTVMTIDAGAVTYTKTSAGVQASLSLADTSVQPADISNMLETSDIGVTVQAYDADLTSWAGVTRASGFDTFATTPSSANLRALLSDEEGTGAAYFVGGALGTPSSATLTNATGLPVSGITASTSTALGVGSIELGHATDTTISRVSAGVIAVEGVNIATSSSTNTFTNKTFDANGTGNSITNIEVADLAGSAVITAAEGIGSNNVDTALTTSAAVKTYVDAAVSSGVADGDKGDITVSGGGVTWAVDANAITNAKLAQITTNTIKGRVTAATGDVEDLSAAQVKTILALTKSDVGLGNVTNNAQLPLAGGTMTGLLTTNGQVKFPSTQNPSADANTLDDYKESTSFTPAITFGGASVGITYSLQSGSYTKIGNRVFFEGRVTLTNKGSSTGVAKITGLPYTAGNYGACTISYYANLASISGVALGYVDSGDTTIQLQNGNAATSATLSNSNFTNTSDLLFFGNFRV